MKPGNLEGGFWGLCLSERSGRGRFRGKAQGGGTLREGERSVCEGNALFVGLCCLSVSLSVWLSSIIKPY